MHFNRVGSPEHSLRMKGRHTRKARAFSRSTSLPTPRSSTAVSRNRAGRRGSSKPAPLHLTPVPVSTMAVIAMSRLGTVAGVVASRRAGS